jgi:hypothetical protein
MKLVIERRSGVAAVAIVAHRPATESRVHM